jgi:predicted Zn-dependent protease/predicted membrane protein
MIEHLNAFLGPARIRALILLLALTGLFSLILRAFDSPEADTSAAQSVTLIVFLVGAVLIVGSALDREGRIRWLSILAPALGAIVLGLTVLPQFMLALSGAAVGWIIAGAIIFRPRVPREFQQAVKHLRKGEYSDAVESMNAAIKDDPDNEDYYRFRAEVFRLWGKLDRARKDYEKMIELAPDEPVAWNGLAEVHLQSGRYAEAQQAGLRAYELAPNEWVAAYNLGMIEDRLNQPQNVIEHLQVALKQRVPDARHRLLIHLYLARAYHRTGDQDAAKAEIEALRREHAGLEEWQKLLVHEQAAALRAVLADDVQLAQDLVDGKAAL